MEQDTPQQEELEITENAADPAFQKRLTVLIVIGIVLIAGALFGSYYRPKPRAPRTLKEKMEQSAQKHGYKNVEEMLELSGSGGAGAITRDRDQARAVHEGSRETDS